MSAAKRHRSAGPRKKSGSVSGNWFSVWYLAVPLVLLLTLTAPWQRTLGNFFAPYLMLNESIAGTLTDQTLKLRSRSALAAEVTRLNEQNVRLAVQAAENYRLHEENRQLRNMLKLQNPPGFEYVASNVLLRDPWMWESGFTIDRGSKDGLQPGLAVLFPAVDREDRVILLGVIESVGKYTSRVISVLNPELHISLSLPESRAVGFLNAGQSGNSGSGTAAIGFLPANSTFAINEPIYTTGHEPAIPGGLWVGNLESIEQSALPFGNRLYRSALMRPAGDLEHLRTVIVAKLCSEKSPSEIDQK